MFEARTDLFQLLAQPVRLYQIVEPIIERTRQLAGGVDIAARRNLGAAVALGKQPGGNGKSAHR